MSALLFADDIEFVQRLLRSSGCYGGSITGVWDAQTDSAEAAYLDRCKELASVCGTFDERSERNIRTLHPKAQECARRFLKRLTEAGMDARIISGTRSYAEQNRLYRIGRFRSSAKRVTNARGGQSNHNFGIAWDIGIFERGNYLGESELYARAAQIGVTPDLEWGGAWKTFIDRPHYQLKTALSVTEMRTRFEAGDTFV